MFFDEQNIPAIIKNIDVISTTPANPIEGRKIPQFSGSVYVLPLIPYKYLASKIYEVISYIELKNRSFNTVHLLFLIDALYSWHMRMKEPFFITKLTDALWTPDDLNAGFSDLERFMVRETVGEKGIYPSFYFPVSFESIKEASYEEALNTPHNKYTYKLAELPRENSADDCEVTSFIIRCVSAFMLIQDRLPEYAKYISTYRYTKKNLSSFYSGYFAWINKESFDNDNDDDIVRGTMFNDLSSLFPLKLFELIYTWVSLIPEPLLVPNNVLWAKRLTGLNCSETANEIFDNYFMGLTNLDRQRYEWKKTVTTNMLKGGQINKIIENTLGRSVDIKYSCTNLYPITENMKNMLQTNATKKANEGTQYEIY